MKVNGRQNVPHSLFFPNNMVYLGVSIVRLHGLLDCNYKQYHSEVSRPYFGVCACMREGWKAEGGREGWKDRAMAEAV